MIGCARPDAGCTFGLRVRIVLKLTLTRKFLQADGCLKCMHSVTLKLLQGGLKQSIGQEAGHSMSAVIRQSLLPQLLPEAQPRLAR